MKLISCNYCFPHRKIISTKPIDNVHPINRVPDMVPLKSYADSDVEDNEQPISSRFIGVGYRNTPEKCISTLPIGGDLTPPASTTKDEDGGTLSKYSDDEGDANDFESRRHRLKRTHSGRFSYLKRLPTAPSTVKRGRDNDGIRTLLDDSSSEEDDLETMEALYTPLRYLEVKGVMHSKPSVPGGKQKSALWRDNAHLESRIRISYRRKLEDQQLQFALIIYESLNGTTAATPTRRNLMSQFTMSVEELPQQTENEREQYVEETVLETMPTMISIPQTTTLFGNDEDPLQEEASLESLSVAQMRTPTKFTHTPPATPKRKPRSLLATTSGFKRLNSSPTAPTPKRSAARSLRL